MGLPKREQRLYYLPPVTYRPSPNQSDRQRGVKVDLIVCHTPEGPYDSMVDYIRSPAANVSYHILIREDGKRATQFLRFARKAWHALDANSRSEGIAVAGFASSTFAFSPKGRAMARVVAYRLKERGLPPRWARGGKGAGFCRHADLQDDRSDPMRYGRWLAFVAMVKYQYRRGGFRRWGIE